MIAIDTPINTGIKNLIFSFMLQKKLPIEFISLSYIPIVIASREPLTPGIILPTPIKNPLIIKLII